MADKKKEIKVTAEQGKKNAELQKYSSPFADMEHMFDDLFHRHFFAPSFIPRFRFPEIANVSTSIDMFEDGTDLVIKAELPGMKKEDISVDFADDTITISGEKKTEERSERKDFYRVERSFGSFVRKIRLPVEIQFDKVNATFTNGVLEIRMPKSEEKKQNVRKISVK